MTFRGRAVLFFALSAVSVAIDQVTKVIANATLKGTPTRTYFGDTFRFTWATNEGAFLSLGAALPPQVRFWVLTIGVGGLLLGLAVHALRNATLDRRQIAAYACIVSGGFSNWIDRARFGGSVVDFMNVGIGQTLRSGIFNVADLAILVGIGLLLLHGQPKAAVADPAALAAPSADAVAPVGDAPAAAPEPGATPEPGAAPPQSPPPS